MHAGLETARSRLHKSVCTNGCGRRPVRRRQRVAPTPTRPHAAITRSKDHDMQRIHPLDGHARARRQQQALQQPHRQPEPQHAQRACAAILGPTAARWPCTRSVKRMMRTPPSRSWAPPAHGLRNPPAGRQLCSGSSSFRSSSASPASTPPPPRRL
eukprot:1639019-Prymnesium_polylepis.1